MRELLRKAKPTRLDDLIALNALYRPGPLKSGMVDDWVERKQGKREVKYELQALEPILSDTYGVIAYQEQVMRIAQALAGFSLGQADVLRKAMGKKDPKVMAKQRDAFMDGARAPKGNEKKGGNTLGRSRTRPRRAGPRAATRSWPARAPRRSTRRRPRRSSS